MSAAQTSSSPPSELQSVKMENRKRLASDDQGSATPPPKRQAVVINGIAASHDTDVLGKDSIEAYQKDAILRRMNELKREKALVEQAYEVIQKDSRHHDEHIRAIDAWFLQMLKEIEIFVTSSPTPQTTDVLEFSTRLIPSEGSMFDQHLRHRTDEIKSVVNHIFSRFPALSPEAEELRKQISEALSSHNESLVQQKHLSEQNERLETMLADATSRYLVAEKKADRARSAQITQIQAQASTNRRSADTPKSEGQDDKQTNGIPEDEVADAKSQVGEREARAAADKRAEQIDKLMETNKKLTSDLTTAQSKLANLTDEDYAESDLFKAVKSQYEDQIKRVNDLEARNIELRESITHLQAERTAFREENEKQLRDTTIDLESQVSRGEADLARIRQMRDQKVAELDQRVATMDQSQVSIEHLKGALEAKDARITSLESEIERLRPNEATEISDDSASEELKKLKSEKAMLEKELDSMGSAWKKLSAAANKKVMEGLRSNENLMKLSQEKAKADQKYFATMKLKTTMEAELKVQKAQNSKSSEIITQLKDSESSCRSLLTNLEKQLAEAKDSLATLGNQYQALQQNMTEQKHTADQLTGQVSELKKSVAAKDKSSHAAAQAQRQTEVEYAELKARLEETQKSLETWKKRGMGNTTDEFDALRHMAICAVCKRNFKDTALKTCGHVMCSDCVQERLTSRSRKCPLCSHPYGHGDLLKVTL